MNTGTDGGDSSGPGGAVGNGAHPGSNPANGQTPIDDKGPAGVAATDPGGPGGATPAGAPGSKAAAEKAAAEKKRPARRGKPPPDRPVRALFCLPLKNPVRKLCIDIVEWKYPFCIRGHSLGGICLTDRAAHRELVSDQYSWG